MAEAAAQLPGLDALRLELRPWMPAAWRRALLDRREVELRIPEPVRRRRRRPKKIPPSQWSVRFRRMPAADAHPGAYRPEFARFSAKVMDTWALPWVREVWFSGVDQASKTNTMLSCMGWSIEHAPGNIFYQMPDKESSDRIMGRKLIPMLTGSPSLAALLSRRADDTSLNGVTLADGIGILPSWAGSATSTATFSARYTFSDEVDKMRTVGKEASPVARIRKRIKNVKDGKNFFGSTPAEGWIYSGVRACVQVWEAAARCPHCHQLVVMDEKFLDIPSGATPESLKLRDADVGYFCNACGERWSEGQRRWAGEHGDWVCTKGADELRPVDVGFILSAWPLPDFSLAEIAAVVLKARGGDLSAKRDLAHGIKAVDHQDVVARAQPKEEELLRFRDPDLPPMTVPAWADFLVALGDMQQVGFWFNVWAVEKKVYGGRKALIHYGRLATWDDLEELALRARYPVQGEPGNTLGIWKSGLDTGGGKSQEGNWSRTTEAYTWLRAKTERRDKILALKGIERRRDGQPKVRISLQDRKHKQATRSARGGLPLWLVDAPRFKDDVAEELRQTVWCTFPACGKEVDRWAVHERGGLCPECGHELHGATPLVVLHSGTGPDWARQILAEEKHLQKDGTEEWARVRADNHHLDLYVYLLAVISPEAGGIQRAPRRVRPKPPPEGAAPPGDGSFALVPAPEKPAKTNRPRGGFVSGWRRR